jgi:NADP-dependent aldehyde dehydrogenase
VTASTQAIDPRTGEAAGPALPDSSPAEVETTLAAAAVCAGNLRGTAPEQRARWLAHVADELDRAAPDLLPIAERETGLAQGRLTGELARTTGQLRLFASADREGSVLEATIDHADPLAQPPYPDLRRVLEPLGPVLVFAAGNFPFAFSVAGTDTAAALAAGCPVVLKAHPGHPGLSASTAEVVQEVLRNAGAPDGALGLVHGMAAGTTAITDPRIRCSAFTGSLSGGRALHRLAAGRPDPIPFYGELGSINPVLATTAAVARRGTEIVEGFVASFTLGAGQFCTKPGVLLVPRGHGLEDALARAVAELEPAPMLMERIRQGFVDGAEALAGHPEVRTLSAPALGPGPGSWIRPGLFSTSAATVLSSPEQLLSECFGPASLLVEYTSLTEAVEVISAVGGALTVTVHAEDGENLDDHLPRLTEVAGRLVWNGWPTGVAVGWATHHGGPWPATTDPLHTSVGVHAMRRFLRPVAYQSVPDHVLPPSLREDNPWGLTRRVDGVLVPGKHAGVAP